MVENYWLDLDTCFLALAEQEVLRCKLYEAFVNQEIALDEQNFIRDAVERNQLTGNNRFTDEIENRLGIRVECRGRGRPSRKLLANEPY